MQERIGDILVRRELIDAQTLRRALAEQPTKHQRLVSMLINQTLLELDEGALALSELTGYPAVLERDFERRSPALVHEIALDLCVRWAVIPLARMANGTLIVCARDPSPMLAHALREALEVPIALAIAPALHVEKVIRSVCKEPPDAAPAFLAAQVDRPPPGWARRTVSELMLSTVDPAPPPRVEPPTPQVVASQIVASKIHLELDELDENWDELRDRYDPDRMLQSEPALIVSRVTTEERNLPTAKLFAPEVEEFELPPPEPLEPLPLSSIGIGVPPSDPANIIPDPAAFEPDPAAVPLSYEATPSGRQHSIAIPKLTDPLPPAESPPLAVLIEENPSSPAIQLPRTSTLSAAFADLPKITTGAPPASSGTTAPPPIADTALVNEPDVVAQPTITTASMIGVLPPPPTAAAREVERAMSRVTADRLVIQHAAEKWKSVVLLAIADDLARGNRGQGVRLAKADSLQLAIPLCSLLRNARESKAITMALSVGSSDPLLDLIGAPSAAMPIIVDDTPVAFLAAGEPIGELSPAMDDLQILAIALGHAYRRFR